MMPSTTQHAAEYRTQSHQAGFTLVEVLVGLAIGMIATLVIMQVFSAFEDQKRTTTGVSDTMTNGNISLYKITRDVQQAGWGLEPLGTGGTTSFSPLKCATLSVDPAIPASGISPVTVIDGGVGLSDTITVRYGSTNEGGIPTPIRGVAGNEATLDTSLGCDSPNNVAVIINSNGTDCSLSQTAVAQQSSGNPPVQGKITLSNPVNAVVGGTLSCLGTWHEVTYMINASNQLQRTDVGAAAGFNGVEPIVTDVVSLQAQYGVAAAGLLTTDPDFNKVAQWVDATGAFADPIPLVDDRNRIKAVRIAIVARDPKRNVGYVTDPCPTNPKGPCAWPDLPGSPAPIIDLTANPDWRNYRYRVFDMIVPLRNVIWSDKYL